MATRSKYKTKQREILLDYFKTVPGAHITAGDVCRHLQESGASIAQATVYRQLERLVSEGILNKYIIDSSSPACFEYIGSDSHESPESCFHCKCEKCGKLIHLSCDDLEKIQVHLDEHHRFKLNPMRTVFYGLCDECRAAEAEE